MARETRLHTHFGALIIAGAFLGTLLAGTLWKLSALHMVASGNPTLKTVGKGMLFQYN